MELISTLLLVSFQHAWEPIQMSQRLTALTEELQFAMEKEQTEFQEKVVYHHSQFVIGVEPILNMELKVYQVLIASQPHFQLVVLLLVDKLELIAKSERQENQSLLHKT